ncbi:cyclin-dependent kinase 4-like [Sycon ciliatum]|uniref:cyclin-dependent kinase 4-like n=1 Tax=Sycon ciliatum TaxID=27933 RepID=UPI0031F703CC
MDATEEVTLHAPVPAVAKAVKARAARSLCSLCEEPVDYRKKYTQGSLLGTGASGSVFEVWMGGDISRKFAAKIHKGSLSEAAAKAQVEEIRVLRRLNNCDHVLRLTDVCAEPAKPEIGKILVLELGSTPLTDFIKPKYISTRVPNEDVAKKFSQQLVCGLAELHRLNIAHRDIKPANVVAVVDQEEGWRMKYCDFGQSTIADDNQLLLANILRGTFPYFAPEEFFCETFNFKADVWSLAMVLARLWRKGGQKLVPNGSSDLALVDRIKEYMLNITCILGGFTAKTFCEETRVGMVHYDQYDAVCSAAPAQSSLKIQLTQDPHKRPDLNIPQTAVDLLAAMLQYDPVARLSADQACQHPYFHEEEAAASADVDKCLDAPLC